jgi:hypothetical protein
MRQNDQITSNQGSKNQKSQKMNCFWCGSPNHIVGAEPRITCPWKLAGVSKGEATHQQQLGTPSPDQEASPYYGRRPPEQAAAAAAAAAPQGQQQGSDYFLRRLNQLAQETVRTAENYARALAFERAQEESRRANAERFFGRHDREGNNNNNNSQQ